MEENLVTSAVEEIKGANEEQLRKTIEDWYNQIHTQSMRVGAKYIAAGALGIINKHTKKAGKISLRDYERCVAELLKMISVQLKETQQNDLEEQDDRATESVSDTNS